MDYIDIDWLQNVIENKENNISRYPEKYHENWLLLVSDFGTKSSAHRFDHIDFSQIETKFDKVYIYNFMPDKVGRVK